MSTPWYQDPQTYIGGLGLLGGAFGFFRSVFAGRRAKKAQTAADAAQTKAVDAAVKAADAQADATSALARSADADGRIAEALEVLAGTSTKSAPRASTTKVAEKVAPVTKFKLRPGAGRYVATDKEPSREARAVQALEVEPVVHWALEARADAPGTYRLRNVGTIRAHLLDVQGIPEAAEKLAQIVTLSPFSRDLDPGAATIVRVQNRLTLTVAGVTVSWKDSTSAQKQSAVIVLP